MRLTRSVLPDAVQVDRHRESPLGSPKENRRQTDCGETRTRDGRAESGIGRESHRPSEHRIFFSRDAINPFCGRVLIYREIQLNFPPETRTTVAAFSEFKIISHKINNGTWTHAFRRLLQNLIRSDRPPKKKTDAASIKYSLHIDC